jgi:hypothetical protein
MMMLRLLMVVEDGDFSITRTPFQIVKETEKTYQIKGDDADTIRVIRKDCLNDINDTIFTQTHISYKKGCWVKVNDEQCIGVIEKELVQSAEKFFRNVSKISNANLSSVLRFKEQNMAKGDDSDSHCE